MAARSDSEWAQPARGCSSILAAADVVELGFARAGDVVGGYAAWKGDGLPTRDRPVRADGDLPGMGRPD